MGHYKYFTFSQVDQNRKQTNIFVFLAAAPNDNLCEPANQKNVGLIVWLDA